MIRSIAFAACLLAAPAEAATITYFHEQPDRSMTISEELLGRSLADTTVTFLMVGGDPDRGPPAWLLDFHAFRIGELWTTLTFTTSASKNIVSWFGDSYGDPTSLTMTEFGQTYWYEWGHRVVTYPAGKWTQVGYVPAVPLPATLPLLATAIAGVLFLKRRRS